MEPEIALVAAGVETDVDGAGLNPLNPTTVEEIIAHPRHGRALLSRGRKEAGAINR
jgi:mono/diheme cytochrome c family protein